MLLLFRNQLWSVKNAVLRMRYPAVFKALAFGGLGGAFLTLLYYGFIRLLWEVKIVALVGDVLITKLVAMGFLTMFTMIIFSSILISLTTLFFARDLSFLMFSPLGFRTIFLFKALETAVFSSWMVVLATLPFWGAYGMVYELGPGFFAALTALMLPFVIGASALGTLISLGLMALFPARRVRSMMLILGAGLAGGLYMLIRWLGPEKLVRADSFDVVVQYVQLLEAPVAPWWPSWWMTKAVLALKAGSWSEAVAPSLTVFGFACLLSGALAVLAEKFYYEGWNHAQEAPLSRRKRPLANAWRGVPPFLPAPLRALLGKDLLLFSRDVNQWSQFLLLLSLVGVYLMSIQKLPLDTPFLRSLISFLNIGMTGFVLTAVALRFIYPLVSLEGKSWWVVRASPFPVGKILLEKWFLGFLPLAAMGVSLVWASNTFLKVDPFIVRLSNVTVLMLAGALSAMGVGFGALFPRFQVENVAQIETSPGGMFFMVCALFYIGAVMAMESVLVRMNYAGAFGQAGAWPEKIVLHVAAGLLVLNLLAAGIPLLLGARKLESADL